MIKVDMVNKVREEEIKRLLPILELLGNDDFELVKRFAKHITRED